MGQKEMIMRGFESALNYHIWMLSSTGEWIHLCKDPLTDHEETLFLNEDLWPNSLYLDRNNYSTCYQPQAGSQLFEFATEVPESTIVRA